MWSDNYSCQGARGQAELERKRKWARIMTSDSIIIHTTETVP